MSIRLRLAIAFLALSLIPVVTVAALSFFRAQGALEDARLAQVETIADLKARSIENFFEDLRQDAAVAQDYFNVRTNLPTVTRLANDRTNPEYITAKETLDSQLKPFQRTKGLANVALVNTEGKIVYASDEAHAARDLDNPLPDPGGKAFEAGRNGIYFADIFENKAEASDFAMVVTAPVHDFDWGLVGVVAFEVDMKPVYELIQDPAGLGATGETLIARRVGDEALFLNPLRHDPGAALQRTAVFGERDAFPIQEAVQGSEGSGISVDYRGEEIIAAWRPVDLPSPLEWGLVAKIDTSEAFSSVTDLRNLAILVAGITLFVVALAALIITSSISKPILALRQGIAIVGSGNLDHKVGTSSGDEIGQVSRAFDRMTEDLKMTTASRDELNREVAERKRAEQALERYTAELERSNAELEEFARVASHDMQEPLRVVTSHVQLLQRRYEGKLGSDADESISYAVEGARRMQTLISDLLVYSRVGTGSKELAPADCVASFDVAVANLQEAIRESGARVTRDPLPTVMAHASQLTQLLQNLIGNAIKFRSEKPPLVHVSAAREEDEWVFSVRDNGIGIDPQYQDRVFGIFQRLQSGGKHPGTGVGLAICKKVVERHGGRMWVESESGQGATFYFTIPRTGVDHRER